MVKMQYVSALLVNGSPTLVIKLYNCGINLGSFLFLKGTQMEQPLQSVCQIHSVNSPDSGLLKLYFMFCAAATWHLKQCVAVSGVIGFISCLFSLCVFAIAIRWLAQCPTFSVYILNTGVMWKFASHLHWNTSTICQWRQLLKEFVKNLTNSCGQGNRNRIVQEVGW